MLQVSVSVEESSNPAVQAVTGNYGMFEGTDYAGREVLASL